MARVIRRIKLRVTVNDEGIPQSAMVDYLVMEGTASKVATYSVPTPDWNKIAHNTGAAGEFWRDLMDEIKAAEGI